MVRIVVADASVAAIVVATVVPALAAIVVGAVVPALAAIVVDAVMLSVLDHLMLAWPMVGRIIAAAACLRDRRHGDGTAER